jgi:hypothetical protein
VRVFFGGDRGEAVAALLDGEDWSDEDLDEMARRIERLKKERES